MSTVADPTSNHRRNPFIAALLSLLSVGVGHIYCGRVVVGAVLFAIWLCLLPALLILSWLEPSMLAFLTLFVAPGLLLLATYFASAVWAHRLAASMPTDYTLKDYNHPLVYTALILVGLIYPLSVAVATRSFLWEVFVIPTHSMDPTIQPGDRVLCNHRRFAIRPIRRGDVVVFIPNGFPNRRHIKRVVGVGGDRVLIRDGRVSVNGSQLKYDRKLDEAADYRESLDDLEYDISFVKSASDVDFAEVEVPKGHVFVLGDQRDNSIDSRQLGSIPELQILGRAEYRYASNSWNRIGPFE